MGILGKPAGIFDLHDSNINVGSYIMRKDVKEILNITEEKLNAIKFTSIEKSAKSVCGTRKSRK